MSIEQVCVAVIILVQLICFSGYLILAKFSFYQFVLSESGEMK